MLTPIFKPPFFKSHISSSFPLYCSCIFVSIFNFVLYISYPIVFISKQLSLLSPPLHLQIKVKLVFYKCAIYISYLNISEPNMKLLHPNTPLSNKLLHPIIHPGAIPTLTILHLCR